MAWVALSVEVEREWADALGDALIEAGAHSVSVEWPEKPANVLKALFAEHADPDRALRAAVEASGAHIRARIGVERIADEDWVRASQAQFAPFRVGRLWIGASWHAAPNDATAQVRIDPGLAFGTGSHPTTRLVLGFLERFVQGGERVLDYGCGSGILAIAAAKLGAGPIDAVDIDPQAVEVTRGNARANGVTLAASLPEKLPPGRYDLVVANILAQPLIELAPSLAMRIRPSGRIALAGILDAQADEVCAAYASTCDTTVAQREDGWALVQGVRR
jgi:ribosomal protein L11 methyltransferase